MPQVFRGFLVTISLLIVLDSHATPEDWSPFTNRRLPHRVKWLEWTPQTSDAALETEIREKVGWKFLLGTTGTNRPTATVTKQGKTWRLSVKWNGRTQHAVVPDASDYPEVQLASTEINGDQTPDYILRYDPHGCGLAAIGQSVILVLSSSNGHRSHELYQFGFAHDSLVQFKPGGPWHWVVTETVYPGAAASKDGRDHSFWVYRLFRIEGDSLKAEPVGVEGFPKWIQYLLRPNHSETTLVSTKEKRLQELKLPRPNLVKGPF